MWCGPRCTHNLLLLGQSIQIIFLYSHSVPSSARCNWLYTLVSWSRPKAVLCYYPFCYSTAGTQIQRHSVWLSALPHSPIILPSYVSLQTHTVLPVNKYSLSSRIINTVLVKSSSLKDETECIWAYIDTKHTELHCWKIFLLRLSCLFVFFFFFGFSVKAQNLEWKGSRRSPSCDLPACAHRAYCRCRYGQHTHTGTLTDKQYCRAI